ncbi:hypothetical protein KA089_00120 [Candidatus Woesebacteria bacterium]|nr:hypothetical protein [Candidatus Woesebacteria bacterium]
MNSWSTKFKLLASFSFLFFCCLFVNSTSIISANTVQFDSGSDWTAGTLSQTTSSVKDGQIELEPTGTWGARSWKSPDLPIGVGSTFASDGTDLYATRGNGDVRFWKYSTANDSWTDLDILPSGAFYGSDFNYFDGYIYAIFGGYQTTFARYSISGGSWEMLSEIPDLVYQGGSLSNDGTYIYALRGGSSQDFYRYDVDANSWSPMAGTPATMGQGADLIFDEGAFYTARGLNTTTFYKYTISTNSWSTRTVVPGTINDDIEIDTDGTSIFLTRQTGTNTFYKYNISGNSWSTIANLPGVARYSGSVYNSGDGYLYVFMGNNLYNFWKYDIALNEFVGPVDAPATLNTGSDALFYQNKLYVPRGGGVNTLYSYTIASNTWATLATAPSTLNNDTKGVVAGANLYFFSGANVTAFYSYSVGGNSWSTLAVAPSTVGNGAALTYPGSGDYIYATRGNATTGFWRYSISGNSWSDPAVADLPADATSSIGSRLVSDGTDIYYIAGIGISRIYKYVIGTDTWSELGPIPFAPYYGTDLSYYDGKIYAVSGWYENDFWEYNIAGNTWRKLKSYAGYRAQNLGAYSGTSLENDGAGSFYLTRGAGLPDVLQYTASNTNYVATGTWTSEIKDLGYVTSWTSFTPTVSTPSDSSISYQTQTSSDGSSWEAWQNVSGSTIASTTQRYIKVKATLTSSTGASETPILNNISISYAGDSTDPVNPTTTVGSSLSVGGVSLTSGETYTHLSPYFSWTGATDSEGLVAGYYVYFGTNELADPEVSGVYQTGSTYQVTTPFSTNTYYLIVKTKDDSDNISDATTLFEYDYAGISPSQSLTISDTSGFTGTATDVSVANDEIKLDSSSGGFWTEETLSSAPATMQYGSKNMAYVETDNDIYVFRGNNSTTFYKYDLDTDAWSTLSNAPATVRMGGGVIEGPLGYLYGMRGNNTTSFWKYDIADNLWSDVDAADAPLTIYYGGSLVFDGTENIYVMRGNNDDAFWKYDTTLDQWETLASVDFGANSDAINNSAYISADLAIDTANEIIYATQGNYRDGFSQYNINTNAWTVLTDLPALPYLGSSIEYDPTTQTVLYMPGNYSELLYQYSVSTQEWTQKSSAPATLYYGGNIRKAGDNFYVLRGTDTTTMYKYNLTKDSWLTPTGGLFGRRYQGLSYEVENYGADILKGDGDNFYITRGNYSDDFVKWNQSTGTSTNLSNLPTGAYLGSSLVYDSTNNKIYYSGGSTNRRFYVYDINTDVWTEETADPPPLVTNYGSSMVYDGSRYIYVSRGEAATNLYRFDTQASAGAKWSSMASAPLGLGYGAELLLSGGYIYTLRGQNVASNPFYRYDIGANTWTSLTNIGIDVYNDGFLANGGDGNFYAARGEDDNDFYKYSVSGNSWSTLANAPARIAAGGSGESNNLNKVYMLSGTGTGSITDGIYTYVMETADSGFQESGSYTSQSHDLTSVYKWANLTLNYESATNASLITKTRTSSDNSDWSSWTAVSSQKQNGNTYIYQINSPANRYIQIEFILTSSDGVYSGTINDYTINYYKDETAPTNPENAGLSVYSNNTPGSAIVSGTWYGHPAPYFDWPDAEATNGASDTTSGSGVAGYYVYFGTDIDANPQTDGSLQTGSSYTASGLVNGSTYYFSVLTVDDAGNVADEVWQPFTYKYDSEAASVPANLTADPSGYSAIDNFDFSWDAATASGSLVSQYCYKTGASTGDYASDQCTASTSVTDVPSYKVGSNIFYVRTKDEAGNYSSYASTQYYYVDSANAPAPPLNLEVTPTTNTANSFAFSWDTPATGSFYGSVANLSYYYSINALPTSQSTSSTSLKYLLAGAYATLPGENVFYIVTKDEAGNINYSNYSQVTFSANTSAPGIPLNIDIADVSVKSANSWKLAVSWEVPSENASNPTAISSYSIHRSIDGTTFAQVATSGGTSYVDVGLTQQTYYYKVKACDSTNNCGAFSDVISLYPDGRFVVAADLVSGPLESDVTTRKATVSWTTARTADSKIAYGTASGDYQAEEVSNSEQVTSHILNMTNLSPGTTYYYVAKWTDEDGNTGSSEEKTFVTAPPPSTEEPVLKAVGLDTALIEFTSTNADRIRIYYGESSTFGGIEDLVTGSSKSTYTVQLKDLTDGTKYYYKINAFDTEGEEYEGEIHSFTTLPRPKISNINVSQVKGTARSTLLVRWDSNTQISSIITYYPISNPGAAKDEVNIALKTGKHQMVLYDLDPQTAYAIIIKGKDAAGNEAVGEIQQISTSADSRPPLIGDLKVETEISGTGEEASAQLVISYSTDEPATAQVEFGEGSGTSYSQKTQEDGTLTNHHLIVISEIAPSKVYHLRAISKDAAGNVAESLDKVIITQKATENALDLVVTNLSAAFGFLGSIGQ